MKRRNFIKATAPAAVLPFMMNGFSLKAFGRSPFLDEIIAADPCSDRVFVIIQLTGGNDGLNTVIPLDQYSLYKNARSNIAVAETGTAAALKLTDATGLHPQMGGMQQLYNNGQLRVIQSVGYPTPDFSHFRSTDILLTASDNDKIISTGWIGRYLDNEYPGYPGNYPNPAMPDPLAIQIGSVISTGFEGPTANVGMAFTDPNTFYNIVNEKTADSTGVRAGQELAFVRKIGQQITKFAAPVKAAAGKAKNKSSLYPAAKSNLLADQLKIVAQLIAGGLKTRIYMVSLGGFDTHASQATGGTGIVSHGTLLNQLSVGITAFQDDLRLLGVQDRVLGMTFSEFGRRIKSNSSGGTDHGAAAPFFVFGTNVQPGIMGTNPIIPANPTSEDNIPMQYDFRSVYASILKDWFCASDTALKVSLFKDFQMLPIVKGSTGVDELGNPTGVALLGNYPNPFGNSSVIRFRSGGNHLEINVFDNTGRSVASLVDRTLPAGEHEVSFDASSLPSGNYYCRLQSGVYQEMKQMLIVK